MNSGTWDGLNVTHFDQIEGYCQKLSYVPGDRVGVCVSTPAKSFSVEVFRWGQDRQLFWSRSEIDGQEQVTPSNADSDGCGWDVVLEVPTSRDWPSGMYLIEMRINGHDPDTSVGHACFVLRAGQKRKSALLVLATNTWNAYNNWGGASLYTGGNRVSFERPFGRGMLVRLSTIRDDRKSRPRYFGEEPDIDGQVYQDFRFEHGYPGYMGSAGWFTYERLFVEWAEREGFEFDYAVSYDLEKVPNLTAGYNLVIGAGHDEYWSLSQRTAIEQFVGNGGNYASFSGNTMFWQVRIEGGSMRCHKYKAHLEDPLLTTEPHKMTGMWADPVVNNPESKFLGAGSMYGLYARFGRATPRGVGGFVVYRDDHWMLEGTELVYGDVLGADSGVVGYETIGTNLTLDDFNLPIAVSADERLPRDIEVVAFSPASNLRMGEYPASIAALDDQGDLEFVAQRIYGDSPSAMQRVRHGNAVMLCCWPFGVDCGQVVTIGSTDWVFGLAERAVARVTANIFHRLS